MTRMLRRLFDALASFQLAIVVLAFLFLLTIIGTLEQTHSSLYEVQRRYFESAFVIHRVAGIPLPLPGVSLLLVVLAVNLVCGGMVRIRKASTTVGVILGHIGILVMLAGSAIESYASQKGHTTLPEGESASEFVSYFDWEIAVTEQKGVGRLTELVIPGEKFMHLAPGELATFTAPELPFELVVHNVYANCEPRAAVNATSLAVDGFALVQMPREKEAESETAGAYVTVRPTGGGEPQQGILWSGERFPMSVIVAERRFTIDFSHRRWRLPFAVHLDDFRQELHPGMGMAKSFESDVTKVENGVPQKIKISMNEPLREEGYTLFQSGFIEPDKGGGGRWWSTFSVVRNPADSVPLWSCIIIAAGLLLHFSQKLIRHVRAESRRRP